MSVIAPRRRAVLDTRSVVVAIVVLLLGAAIGFGVGYEVKAHRTSTAKTAASKAAKTPAKHAGAATGASAAGIAQFRTCLSSHGVDYPAVSGGEAAFSAQIAKPPAGVAQTTYNDALRACYAAGLKTKK